MLAQADDILAIDAWGVTYGLRNSLATGHVVHGVTSIGITADVWHQVSTRADMTISKFVCLFAGFVCLFVCLMVFLRSYKRPARVSYVLAVRCFPLSTTTKSSQSTGAKRSDGNSRFRITTRHIRLKAEETKHQNAGRAGAESWTKMAAVLDHVTTIMIQKPRFGLEGSGRMLAASQRGAVWTELLNGSST